MSEDLDYCGDNDDDVTSLAVSLVEDEIFTNNLIQQIQHEDAQESHEARYDSKQSYAPYGNSNRSPMSFFAQNDGEELDASSTSSHHYRYRSEPTLFRDSTAHRNAGLADDDEDLNDQKDGKTSRTRSTSSSSSSLESQSSLEDGSYHMEGEPIPLFENRTDGFKHDWAMEADLDHNVEPYLTAALSDDPAESSDINVTKETRAVCFGWIKHPITKRWRNVVNQFAANIDEFPLWLDDIAHQVQERLKQEGIVQYYVAVNKRIFNEEKQAVGGWRVATDEEIFFKTKQRFQDDRKSRSQKDKKPVQRYCQSTELDVTRRPAVFGSQAVCFEWKRHPGTVTWLETIQTFAKDYPKWNDCIVDRVREELAKMHISSFFVFRDSNDYPTVSISDGLWVPATDDEIRLQTLREFKLQRSHCKQEHSSLHQERSFARPRSAPADYSTTQGETSTTEQNTRPSLCGQSEMPNCISDFAGIAQDTLQFTDLEGSSLNNEDIALTDPLFYTDGASQAPCKEAGNPGDDLSAYSSDYADEIEDFPAAASFPASKRKKSNDGSCLVLPKKATDTTNSLLFSNFTFELDAAITPSKIDVCFGWIKHPGTKIWRDAVKMFSDNRMEFPIWSDDIVEHVRTSLVDKGIARYLVCRNSAGNSVRKMFDARRELHGMWDEATEQEIWEKTKQRFLNDRKRSPEPLPSCKKRPRGRPSKKQPIIHQSLPGSVEASCIGARWFSGIESDVTGCEHRSFRNELGRATTDTSDALTDDWMDQYAWAAQSL